jgi:hypothetical protein
MNLEAKVIIAMPTLKRHEGIHESITNLTSLSGFAEIYIGPLFTRLLLLYLPPIKLWS